MHYAFSSQSGNLVTYQRDPGVTSPNANENACQVTDWNPIHTNTKRQQILLRFKTSFRITLKYNQNIILRLNMLQMPVGLSFIQYCHLLDQLTCTYSGTSQKLEFVFRNLNAEEVIELGEGEYTVRFYLSHSGVQYQDQQFTAQILFASSLIDECTSTGNIHFVD